MNNEVTEVMSENTHSRITVATLLGALKKFVLIICIVAVLAAALAFAYVQLFTKTSYASNARFYVSNQSNSSPTVDNTTLNAASNVTADCIELIRVDDTMIGKIVDEHRLDELLGMKRDAAKSYVKGAISANKSGEDSRIFTVVVSTAKKEYTDAIISAVQSSIPTELVSRLKTGDSALNLKISALDEELSVYPVRTSAVTFALIAAAIAFVVTYLVCFFIYINDTKVYDDSTIKAHFTAPVIGIIPEWTAPGQESTSARNKKRSILAGDKRDYKGKILSSNTPFGVTEAFNTLRTNLCYSTAAEKCPVFAVTSDFSGAGKSVISANIAASLAMLGKKTLLIECDLRRPELAEVFEVDKKAGLSELLSGVASKKSEVLTNVNIENLDVVLSGRIPPNPSELLGSETMSSFVAECKEIYDIIIVDTPPAFEVSDVGVIASLLTGTIMVARSNYSDINAIAASEELISGVNGRIVGYVVNDVDYKAGSGYRKNKYGYRGYRKYARYYSAYSKKPETKETND